MDYRPTTIQSPQRQWRNTFAVLLLLLVILLFPVMWPATELWRYYRLYSRGYWAKRKGRDSIEYQERHDDRTIRRFEIEGEMMVGAPHAVYLPPEDEWNRTVPVWARGRRDEI